tara:strand:- start:245 stop:589 length:345 start_codon:yes stop_codon:yes gene_type:complete
MDKASIYLDQNTDIMQDLKVSYKVRKKWKKIVGAVLAKNLQFNYIKKDQCFIAINNPCWYSEITLYEQKVIENINNYASPKKIKSLKLVMNETKKEITKRQYALRKNYDNMIGR